MLMGAKEAARPKWNVLCDHSRLLTRTEEEKKTSHSL